MAPFRTGYIYVNDIFAGKLEEIENGYSFTYDLDYLSLSDAKATSPANIKY